MSDLATLRIVVDASGAIRVVDQFGNATEKAAKQTDALEKAAKRAGQVLGVGLVAGLGLAVKETADAQREQAQLAAALRSTAGASGQTLDSLNAQAESLRRLTAATGGEIAEAQALLLTFTKIGGEVFPRATQVTLDMAQALGTDARAAALQLGKALNDPVLGVTALGRAGVQFNDQQKAVIASLVETNRLAEAQTMILRELETQVGGSAAAYRNTLGGALAAVRESFLELFEIPGGEGMNRLVESINRIADGFGLVRNSIQLAVAEFDLFLASNNEAFLKGLSYTTFGVLGNDGAGSGFDLETQINRRAAAEQRIRQLTNERPGLAARITDGAAARRGATLGTLGTLGSGGASADPVLGLTYSADKLVESVKAANDAVKDFAQTVDDNLRQKALGSLKASLDEIKASEEARSAKAREAFKERLAETKQEADALGETARVFTEQTQLALGRFGSDFLKDGFKSLDRFWGDFVQLGRDAIGNVFAKSVMDTLGDTLADGIGGLFGKLGGVGGGIVGAVGAGIALGLDRMFGESKWERAAEEQQRAARALQAAAGDLKAATMQSQAQWLDDFLNYANDETPLAKELRSLTTRRDDLARSAWEIAQAAGGSVSNATAGIINRGDWALAAERARQDALGLNQTDVGRQALLDFADALDRLNAALADNREAALRATDAQQELTLAQFRDSLGADATGQLSTSQRFAAAQAEFGMLRALAMGGDASAIDSFGESARTLLEAARENFASGVRYQEIFEQVRSDTDALLAAVRARAGVPLEGVEAVTPPGFYPAVQGVAPLPPGVDPATVGFDYATASAITEQTDRALAVANAQLAVQQEGFTAVTGALLEVREALSQVQYTLRTGVVLEAA